MTKSNPKPQGIAHELARTKAELASAQETIAWQRAEIERIIKIAMQNAKETERCSSTTSLHTLLPASSSWATTP